MFTGLKYYHAEKQIIQNNIKQYDILTKIENSINKKRVVPAFKNKHILTPNPAFSLFSYSQTNSKIRLKQNINPFKTK